MVHHHHHHYSHPLPYNNYPYVYPTYPQPIYGTFTYDGAYQLPDGGGKTDPNIAKGVDSPGMIIQVLQLGGSKGATGNFNPGDTLSVTFRVAKTDGTSWHLDEMNSTRAIVSAVAGFQTSPHVVELDSTQSPVL